jgi:hypothetical protein
LICENRSNHLKIDWICNHKSNPQYQSFKDRKDLLDNPDNPGNPDKSGNDSCSLNVTSSQLRNFVVHDHHKVGNPFLNQSTFLQKKQQRGFGSFFLLG